MSQLTFLSFLKPRIPRLILSRLPLSPPRGTLTHKDQEHWCRRHEHKGENGVCPTPANSIGKWEDDSRENSTDLAPDEIVCRGSHGRFARIDIHHEDIQDLECGCEAEPGEEEEDDRGSDADFHGDDPAVGDEKGASDEEQGEGYLQAGFFDGEVG